jgi:hypothetical protein
VKAPPAKSGRPAGAPNKAKRGFGSGTLHPRHKERAIDFTDASPWPEAAPSEPAAENMGLGPTASKSSDVRRPAVHDDLPAFHEETPDERVSLQKFYTEDNAETVTRKSVEVFMTSYYMHRKEPAGERCVSGLQVATSSGAHKPVRVMYREPTPKSWKETWWPAQQMYARAHYTDSFTKYDKKMIFQMNLANAMVLRLKGNPKASPTEKLIAAAGAAANISIASAWRWWGELKVYGAWSNDTYGAHETVSWLLYDRKYVDEAWEWVRSNTQVARGGTHLQNCAKAKRRTSAHVRRRSRNSER